VEVTRITEGFNEGTLPHTYSNTQQLRMLRMMFVKEEGDELWIAPGTPKAWLDTRDGFSIHNAPTVYGALNYRFSPEPEKKLVHVSMDTNQSGSHPAKVRLRLASNLGTLESATLNGQTVAVSGDQIVIDGSQWRGVMAVEAH